jgi:glycosyltransferase involved in cell wall biosynthesis
VLAGHEIENWWDDRWHSGVSPDPAEIAAHDYDCLVVMQAEEMALALTSRQARNVVFIPMWDGARDLPDKFWRGLEHVRIVSFCHLLHERVQALGLRSMYVQYFPEPAGSGPKEFETLRGFFWQRRPEVTWRQIAALLDGASFQGMHLHLAPDPECGAIETPAAGDLERLNITTSSWLQSRADFDDLLESANVFFAPRTVEGIGFALLEAMAAGMCAVAPDGATMNEYITDGVTGLLWDVREPKPLDFAHAERIGRRAMQATVLGRERWEESLAALRTFVLDGSEPRRGPSRVLPRKMNDGVHMDPVVTVVCVTLNCVDDFDRTLSSIFNQDFPALEVIVIDGGSSDGTVERIKAYDELLDYWISEPDDGPFDAMAKGVARARGEYVLFLNAGDRFASDSALSHALRFAPEDADFVYGHHIYRTLDGVERLHKAAEFESTWQRLEAGELDPSWLQGVPCHQATLTRTVLLRNAGGYDRSLRIVADHDFLYRQRLRGARFHHCDVVIAEYVSGGYSWQNMDLCFDEWLEVASRYGPPQAVRAFIERMRLMESRPAQMLQPVAATLDESLRRLRFAKRRARTLVRTAPPARRLRLILCERRIRRSGFLASDWYLETYPDVERARQDPIRHYVRHGAAEGRDPSPCFDTDFYLAANPDVQMSGVNPLEHYVRFGAAEGRTATRALTSSPDATEARPSTM